VILTTEQTKRHQNMTPPPLALGCSAESAYIVTILGNATDAASGAVMAGRLDTQE
jgi:hypothetical protein